jgi:hypothetical protein
MKLAKKPTKAELAREAAFNERFREWLKALGAKPGQYHEFDLDTKFGQLGITPYGDWVACRFEDVERAKAGLPHRFGVDRLNPFSGKWNHHYFDWPLNEAFADFVREINDILEDDRWTPTPPTTTSSTP